MTKKEIVENEQNNMIALVDQNGVEKAMGMLIARNSSLLPDSVAIERIKNSAGFYVSNRKDLMTLNKEGKLQMLYGILKEAMVGCEAGTDFDIVPFKGKPVVIRKKDGWYKIIDMIKPAEIIRFTNNVVFKGDEYNFNPVTEELAHIMNTTSDKYDDIVAAYAYIKFANGFEKTVFMSKKDIDAIRRVSPSANSSFSPWTTMPVKMVKTKVVKELAKELFTLYSGKLNYILANAVNSDEVSVSEIDNKGNIINDDKVYEQQEEKDFIEAETNQEEVIDINNL